MNRCNSKSFIISEKGCNNFLAQKVAKMQKAFSLAEALVTLGLIGVLVVTMISLNNFSDNKERIAEIRMSQVENALMAWGKDVEVSFVETGLGPITNSKSLYEVVEDRFNADSIKRNGNLVTMTVNDINVEFNYAPCVPITDFVECNEDSTIVKITVSPDYEKFGHDIFVNKRIYYLSSRELVN